MFSKYPGRAISLLAVLPLVLSAQKSQEREIPLNNWSTPLYFHPGHAERDATAKLGSLLPLTTNAVSPDALTFVAITPCRLVDTRGEAAGFNGGVSPFDGLSLGPNTVTPFPLQSGAEATANTEPAPCGVIPSVAEAYSLNLTVIPHGGAVDNYVTLWPTGSTQPVVSNINDTQGLIVANSAIVAAGTAGSVNVYNSGPATIDLIIDMNGYFAPGVAMTFSDFFALMPGDNSATVAAGADVSFPQDGPTSGSVIARTGPSSFNLAAIGTYQISFQVSIQEPGQLLLTLNGADLAYTVVGRATGTSQIVGLAVVTTTAINSILTVRNPSGNASALTISPIAGGARAVSAHLVITQLR